MHLLQSTDNEDFHRPLQNPRVRYVFKISLPLSLIIIMLFLKLYFHLRLGFPPDDFQTGFPTKNCTRIPLSASERSASSS